MTEDELLEALHGLTSAVDLWQCEEPASDHLPRLRKALEQGLAAIAKADCVVCHAHLVTHTASKPCHQCQADELDRLTLAGAVYANKAIERREEIERLEAKLERARYEHERDTNTLERLDEAGDKLLGDMPAGVALVFGDGIAALLDALQAAGNGESADELAALSKKLSSLLADPHPGLHAWRFAISDTCLHMGGLVAKAAAPGHLQGETDE